MSLSITQLNEIDLKQQAYKLCQEFLGPPWDTISLSDFNFSKMSGGMSSILYRCFIENNAILQKPNASRQVLLRMNNSIQDEEHIVVQETIIFVILSEKQLGPKLLGLFPKGRLEEFIPSRTLDTDDIRRWSSTIAKIMARIHVLNVPVRKVPDQIPRSIKKWLKEIEKDTIRTTQKSYTLGNMFREEASWLMKEVENSNSPIVFCHNDLNGGNILLREDSIDEREPNITFIDFEWGSYNHRAFDIANLFCEWAYDYNTPEPPYFTLNISKYPTRQEKVGFIQAYLEQLVEEGALDAADIAQETSKILKEIKLFQMVVQLYWTIWCEKWKFETGKEAFCVALGKSRLNFYWKLKENYMKEKAQVTEETEL